MIKVLKSGFYSSIQDKGRKGYAAMGVPISGSMDAYAADIANSILGNSSEASLIEITFGGMQLQFLSDSFICISGGDFSAKINDTIILMNSRIRVFKNDVLSFGKINFGVRCYLAVKGGFQTEKKLGSASFYKNITPQTVIQKNTLLAIKEITQYLPSSNASIKKLAPHFTTKKIHCFKGPEFDCLKENQKKVLFEQFFTISKDNNRMGYRLKEPIKNNLPAILTSAVFPGTVQLTPSGKLIILMRDCQVTGGYPRVLQLSKMAINQLAQKTTNDQFNFVLKEI